MRREECYRILEVPPDATPEQIRSAWRELTKVWHTDRFGNDEKLRRRAEEKLKEINRAYEILREGGGSHRSQRPSRGESREQAGEGRSGPRAWTVRDSERQMRAESFEQLARWVLRGRVVGTDEVWDPRAGGWVRVAEVPELGRLIRVRTLQRWTRFALFCGMAGLFLLLRKPVGVTAVLALALIGWAAVMLFLYRRSL
jgi:hypothetical protein